MKFSANNQPTYIIILWQQNQQVQICFTGACHSMKFLTTYSHFIAYCCKEPGDACTEPPRECGVNALTKGTKALTLNTLNQEVIFCGILQKLIFGIKNI
jgi:hypothetical protein